MWWDEITLQSSLAGYDKKKIIFLYHLYQFSSYPHAHETAWHFFHSKARTATSSLMHLRGCCRKDPSDENKPKHVQMGKTKNPTVVLSSLQELSWKSVGALAVLSTVWLYPDAWCTAWQMMFCRHSCFLDTLPDIHPHVWTSVHKGLAEKSLGISSYKVFSSKVFMGLSFISWKTLPHKNPRG